MPQKNTIIQLILLFLFLNQSFAKVTVIHNIQGHSINKDKHVKFTAMAIENNKVLATGESKSLLLEYPNSEKIDGDGLSLLPGLHDSHSHVFPLAKRKRELSLKGVDSLDETLKAISDYAKNSNHFWVIVNDWNFKSWKTDTLPTKHDLDRINTYKPIWIKTLDGSTSWVNSKAMGLAKSILIKPTDITNGTIQLDSNGKQTGIFFNGATSIISNAFVNRNVFESLNEINNIFIELSELGLTSINDFRVDWRTYHSYKRLKKEDRLPIRVNAVLFSGAKMYGKMLELGIINDPKGILNINTISYVLDSFLLTQKAALIKPYNDNKNTSGRIRQSTNFIKTQIRNTQKLGWQASIDATGDKAVKIALEILSDPEFKKDGFRPRIEHAKIIDLKDINKFSENNIIASINPTSTTTEMEFVEDRVGRSRLRGGYAWKTLMNNGTKLVSGSNAPYESANPFYGIHAAVTRQNRENQPTKGWIPVERLSVKQALASYTINAAYANHQEQQLGSLEPGKWADFILVDQNIFTINPQDIWKTQVIQTWVAGKNIYNNPNYKPEKIFSSSLEK